jgi:TrmH family RNA methyltransferase
MITSSANPTVKQIRKLRERKERQTSGLFYAEGLRIVAEAVQQNAPIETVIVAPELLTGDFGNHLVDEITAKHTPVLEVSADIFRGMALKEGPQGLAAVIRQSWVNINAIEPQGLAIWVALDAVADPGNLGTILRTNDAIGGQGIILVDNCTDPYDPTSIRASMGAVFSQRLVKTTFEAFAAWKRRVDIPLIGTSGAAKTDYQGIRYPRPVVIYMGSERQGLQEYAMNLCDELVRIPMVGRSDSLNLAVATAITLYEVFNQRRPAAPAETAGPAEAAG